MKITTEDYLNIKQKVIASGYEKEIEWTELLVPPATSTKYHLTKNLGSPIAKPDKWLQRITKNTGESPQELCERLSYDTNDKIATIDNILWRACNLNIININEEIYETNKSK